MSTFLLAFLATSASATSLALTAAATLTGEEPSELFPHALVAADVDGDGYDDAVVLARCSGSCSDALYVYPGGPGGPTSPATVVIPDPGGTSYYEYWGPNDLDAAGDLNGDGYEDVVVGSQPSAYVYYGGPGGLDPANVLGDYGDYDQYDFGRASAGVGDFDGDGYDDFVYGSQETDTLFWYGSYRISWGGASGLQAGRGLRVDSSDPYLGLGAGVDGLGDVDADGYADFAVTSLNGTPYYGRVDVVLGGPDRHHATIGRTYNGDEIGAGIDGAAGPGDVDGDGYDDLVLIIDDPANIDGAWLYFGAATGPGATPDQVIALPSGATSIGVSPAGDLNGDGYDDVGVLASTGRLDLYLGGPGGLDLSAPAWTIEDVARIHAGLLDDGVAGDLLVGTPTSSADPGVTVLLGEDPVPAVCTVDLLQPTDGADLTASGRFVWDGDCDGYRLELSPSPDFPAYDTIYNARLTDAAGPQTLTFPAAAWPNVSRRFADGGYARVVGGVGGETAASPTVSFDTSGLLSTFPAPAATCSVSLVEPADGATISGSPRFGWSTGCTAARLEFSADPNFPLDATVAIGAFSGNRADLDAARWSTVATSLPDGGYWRVVAGASDGEHPSGHRTFVLP